MLQIWQLMPTIAQQIIIAVIAGAILWIVSFPIRQFITQRPERKKEWEQKLRTHLEDIKKDVISHISEMARNLTIRNNRLVFGSYAPVSKSYAFEKQESYEYFKLHFLEFAQEWEHLNERALKHQEWLEVLNSTDTRIGFMEALQEVEQPLADGFSFEDEMESYEASNSEFVDSYKRLTEDFKDFAGRLAKETENISKYEIGRKFKRNKKCPVCRKF